jgi:hypothetical protein
LDLGGAGTIVMVRRVGRHLYLWARHADVWRSIPLPDRRPLDVIQGRVSLVVQQLRGIDIRARAAYPGNCEGQVGFQNVRRRQPCPTGQRTPQNTG